MIQFRHGDTPILYLINKKVDIHSLYVNRNTSLYVTYAIRHTSCFTLVSPQPPTNARLIISFVDP